MRSTREAIRIIRISKQLHTPCDNTRRTEATTRARLYDYVLRWYLRSCWNRFPHQRIRYVVKSESCDLCVVCVCVCAPSIVYVLRSHTAIAVSFFTRTISRLSIYFSFKFGRYASIVSYPVRLLLRQRGHTNTKFRAQWTRFSCVLWLNALARDTI